MTTPTVLFVCTHNAGRSALGAALARHRAADAVDIRSAGVAPAETASADTISVLAELGIDDSSHVPTKLTDEMVTASTVVVAMKPGLDIPQIDGVTYETWDLPNPQGRSLAAVRELRDAIDERVVNLLAGLSTGDR